MATAAVAETPKRSDALAAAKQQQQQAKAAAAAAAATPNKTSSSSSGFGRKPTSAASVAAAATTAASVKKPPPDLAVFDFSPTCTTTATFDQQQQQQLKILTDESSSYDAVANACLQLTQAAGCDANSTAAAIVHDGIYAASMSAAWQALFACLSQHSDRRCRMLAARTLAITAKSAHARIRPSPLLSTESSSAAVHRLQDEVGSDVAVRLCTAALEDADDGVAAAAVAAVGLLLQTGSCRTFGGLHEDALAVHLQYLVSCGGGGTSSPYAPVLRSVTDEDPGLALQELSVRIMENVVSPRLLQLTDRVLRMRGNSADIASALPCLTACLVHCVHVHHPATLFAMDRATYSKRWSELDVSGLMDVVVATIVLPAMQQPCSVHGSSLALTAALSGLRLAHAQPEQHWVLPTCQWAVTVLQEEVAALASTTAGGGGGCTETRLALLGAIVVACRAVPISERTRTTLTWLAEQIVTTLPRTVPTSVAGAGLRLEMNSNNRSPPSNYSATTGSNNNCISYRRPARMALWTEVALSFFMDGPTVAPQQRHECLRAFFNSPVVSHILQQQQPLADTTTSNDSSSAATPPPGAMAAAANRQQRDELLLAFTSVAVEAGRRFRVTADGMLSVAEPSCEAVQDWLLLVWVVLTSFMSCAFAPTTAETGTTHYLDENLSLLTAGLATYVQLLQEYLHFVGLLHPSSSVALKLGANACPPHILWDRMTESASFLARFEGMDLDCLDNTTKLLDELVSREMKQGIPSHHMRLFVLALAADHWVQGRIAAIRKPMSGNNAGDALALNMKSGREILLALAPKRLLAKIIKAHVPPVDGDGKPKRDPIKKLALESARVSVACIENIALMACDWRRRFGSSQESKHIVSVAVGLLQGKVDETPLDDAMKAVMGPTCDAAVVRIQSFYESSGKGALDQSFPLSELVTQPVKIKIKPLVSSSKPNPRPRDDVMREYLMQLCRQIVASRIQLSVQASPPADSLLSAARPVNWLRLSVPPLPESKDGRLYGCRGEAMSAWGHSVTTSSAASDAVQLIVAYTPRRYLRCDGEDDYRITVLMRAFNMTAIDIVEGLRLEFGIAQNAGDDDDDPVTLEHVESLGCKLEDVLTDLPLSSAAVDYKQELKSGDFITWEIALNDITRSNSLRLVPSVVYRNVPVESEDAGVKWVGEKPSGGEGSTVGGEFNSGEDDFQLTSLNGTTAFEGENSKTENVRLIGEALTLPPLILCQPCPLVFFTDRRGDADSFRFLWFRFPFHLAPIKVVVQPKKLAMLELNPITRKIAKMSSLLWEGEAIPGGVATNLWAFMTLSGQRVFCVLTESDSPNSESQRTLYFRGDDQSLLYSLIGSKTSRDSVVSSLLPGMSPIA